MLKPSCLLVDVVHLRTCRESGQKLGYMCTYTTCFLLLGSWIFEPLASVDAPVKVADLQLFVPALSPDILHQRYNRQYIELKLMDLNCINSQMLQRKLSTFISFRMKLILLCNAQAVTGIIPSHECVPSLNAKIWKCFSIFFLTIPENKLWLIATWACTH